MDARRLTRTWQTSYRDGQLDRMSAPMRMLRAPRDVVPRFDPYWDRCTAGIESPHALGNARGAAIAAMLLWLATERTRRNRAAPRRHRSVEAARAFLDAGDLARAAASLEAEIARNPKSSDAHYVLGLVRERQRDLPAAARSYEAAIRQAPDMAEARDRLGFVLGQQGKIAEALAQFERAVRLRPDLFDAQYHLGATRWYAQDFERRCQRCRRPSSCVPTMRKPATISA